jgi:hypothetical protein
MRALKMRDLAPHRKKKRSRTTAPGANANDRKNGVKFRARVARSREQKISFSIRVGREKYFCALVTFEK